MLVVCARIMCGRIVHVHIVSARALFVLIYSLFSLFFLFFVFRFYFLFLFLFFVTVVLVVRARVVCEHVV